jgi:hypothetical protein
MTAVVTQGQGVAAAASTIDSDDHVLKHRGLIPLAAMRRALVGMTEDDSSGKCVVKRSDPEDFEAAAPTFWQLHLDDGTCFPTD